MFGKRRVDEEKEEDYSYKSVSEGLSPKIINLGVSDDFFTSPFSQDRRIATANHGAPNHFKRVNLSHVLVYDQIY